ncbi:GCN5 family acetyltransferase [Lysinibacillus xylanilyticus]|uniref:GCN5 family acetyltransferase n=1 Tax=Lysinibacillus xylanilyticus TaxID=582475 RepID=A0A0K9F9V6_9BACI|nr:GNAT family N-acetyltransferase [Lysinibacillus xylanilyticus]KMY31404.1 GCN5 family acetyltransferase [Lysinibacillus xylanilyticus]
MILDKELHIRLMKSGDFDLMVKWLNDQRVLEFYEEPPSNLGRVINKYGPRIEGKHYVIPCIVEYKNESIGYIQYYEIPETELKKYDYQGNQNIYGIDQFIGEPKLWGKGIGTKIIQMMLNYLCNKGASKVLLEVKNDNVRAISSYKKCGFKRIKDLNNNLVLMEWIAKID